ncbi:Hypothetical protein R9X50_00710300 [Acrodontium crateriforme]|uniref:CENP-V/GFA domain-containing protein n=1 Tax=Acrodontium crateriforme TaxID=150365 RepID=A0AAQ3RAH5_9PEZI|nr:Hypothetical protein R9X50_00710300 [Acrodontium crateriforme]
MSNNTKATYHCGDIAVEVPRKPDYINECQCSICRRYAAAWAYYHIPEVQIIKKDGASTKKYIWGDRLLEFHFCSKCGCIVFWWPREEVDGLPDDVGINTRMMEPEVLEGIERRVEEPGT